MLTHDPYMRGRMDNVVSYAPPVKLGEPMTGETVDEVIASRLADFSAGQIVLARSAGKAISCRWVRS
jgi:NADPH-dependent curcumin reductase CurA